MSYPSNSDSVAGDQLRAFVERIERMNEERRAIADDIKEIYAEAKGNGFNTKALKIIIREREQDPADLLEREALLDLYRSALGIGTAIATPARARETDSSLAKAAHAVSRGDDVGERHHSSDPGMDGAVEPGRQTSASADADPAPKPTAADNARSIRPYCLHADDLSQCAGQGRKHCWQCQKAHADDVGEAA